MRSDLLKLAAGTGCAATLVILFISGAAPLDAATKWISREAQAAAVFFVASITAEQIQNEYHNVSGSQTQDANSKSLTSTAESGKVRVLIVPGHQPDTGGTEFGPLKERNLVVDIADALALLLKQNPHYEVMVARTKTAWNPILQTYFDTHVLEIDTYKQSLAAQMQNHIADGSILPEVDQVYHLTASSPAALQLYGINKWASENKYDIILHLHVNDYVRRHTRRVGTYDGFTIYVPDNQYSNATASKAVAESIAARLNAYHATSTLPKEDKGIVEDQELIAIGSNNSVDGAAILIEYGYIYEPQFLRPSVRPVAITDYAYQTYLGLQDFFKDPILSTFGSISFPYDWEKVNTVGGASGPGVYALQAALHRLGYYPPKGKSFSDCPISGVAGACTHSAIIEYQEAHGLSATGSLGPQTRTALDADLEKP